MAEKSQYTESNTEFKRNGNSIYNGEFISYLLEKNFFVEAMQKELRCQEEFVDEVDYGNEDDNSSGSPERYRRGEPFCGKHAHKTPLALPMLTLYVPDKCQYAP